ncbi:hypothetical protein [Halorubellus litoreus]|uniref:DUF7964 domain-containing protein n=1 Tax=Halorubellus litoreus TaxID=755308 RepID=A0ABD5VBA3_9EURY
MARVCDSCGEEFGTLSRLRLHDCPAEVHEELLAALAGEPDTESIPDRPLTDEEFEALRDDERIVRAEEVLSAPGTENKVISFVYESEAGIAFGMHSDHETGEWLVTTRGEATDFDEVEARHDEWVSQDIERVTGGPVDMDNVGPIAEELTVECSRCGDDHLLSVEPSEQMAEIGLMEYAGYCEAADTPLVETFSLEEVMEQ